MSPAPKKKPGPNLEDAMQAAWIEHNEVLSLQHGAVAAAARRQQWIRTALDNGASLRSIAARLGVSPETVRKMADVSPVWLIHLERLDNVSGYRAGYEHRLAGGRATDNPHGPSSPEGIPWMDGWRAAGHGQPASAR